MRKRDVPYESRKIMELSRHQHREDTRHNEPRQVFFARKSEDTRSEKSRAFAKKWLGEG